MKRKVICKRTLSIILALVMAVSMHTPMTVLAEASAGADETVAADPETNAEATETHDPQNVGGGAVEGDVPADQESEDAADAQESDIKDGIEDGTEDALESGIEDAIEEEQEEETIAYEALEFDDTDHDFVIDKAADYVIDDDGTLMSWNLPQGYDVHSVNTFKLLIPESINGITVRAVDRYFIHDRSNYNASVNEEIIKIQFPDTIEEWGGFTANYLPKLTTVNIPKNVKTMNSEMFKNCKTLTNVTIPEDALLTGISSKAFQDCTSLATIKLPDSIQYIYSNAFNGCTSLKTINVPKSLSQVGSYAFNDCAGIESFDMSSVTSGEMKIGEGAFSGTKIKELPFAEGAHVKLDRGVLTETDVAELTIPYLADSMPNGAFQNCTSLTSFIVQDGIKNLLYSYTFDGCTNLKTVEFKGGAQFTQISEYAFRDCSSLKEIVLPGTHTIGKEAFKGCTSLEKVTCTDSAYLHIEENAFSGCVKLKKFITDSTDSSTRYIKDTAFADHAEDFTICAKGNSGLEYYAFSHRIPFESLDERYGILYLYDRYGSGYSSSGDAVKGGDMPPENNVWTMKNGDEEWLSGWFENEERTGKAYNLNLPVDSTKVLYARWGYKDPCTVTFQEYDHYKTERTVERDEYVIMPRSNPTRNDGYTFTGWYKDEACTEKYNFQNTPVTDDITIYAGWGAGYAITFDSRGGTAVRRQDIFVGEKAMRPDPDPTRTNYIFTTWYTDKDCTSEWNFDTVVTQNMTLYAGWKQTNCVVTFNSKGGSYVTSKTVSVGDPVPRPSKDPTKTNGEFLGWYADENCTKEWDFSTPITEDTTLYAGWDMSAYIVKFDSMGGTSVPQQTVQKGESASRPEDPTRDGYMFGDWYGNASFSGNPWNFDTVITSDMTLYAKWEKEKTWTVTFDSNGGSSVPSQTVKDGEMATLPSAPTHTGYTFDGWYSDAALNDPYNFSTPVTKDTTLYAKWTGSEGKEPGSGPSVTVYTVTFESNGGTKVASQNVAEGNKIEKPDDPTRNGYTFAGWFKDEDLIKEWDFDKDIVSSVVKLYAKWTKDEDPGNGGEDPDQPDGGGDVSNTSQDIDDSSFMLSERIDLSSAEAAGTITTGIKAKTYDGTPYMPTVKVTAKADGRTITLTEGTDYRVLYENNVNAGTGRVIVKGNGIYKGELRKEFTIRAKSIAALKLVTGGIALNAAGKPSVYVYDGIKLLSDGKDYTLKIPENMTASAGKKNVTVEAVSGGNYEGQRSVSVTVYDAEKVLAEPDVTLEYVTANYTGKALKPTVTVTFEGSPLDKKYYTVKFANNKDAGTAFVTVTGKKGYAGSVVKTFEIKPLKETFTLTKAIKAMTYSGKIQKPAVAVKVGGKTLKKGKDYTVIYSNSLHATTADNLAHVTIKGLGNYADTPDKTFDFVINAQSIKKVKVKGTQNDLKLTYGTRVLQKDKDYTEAYATEVKGGKVKVTLTGVPGSDFDGAVTKKVKAAN